MFLLAVLKLHSLQPNQPNQCSSFSSIVQVRLIFYESNVIVIFGTFSFYYLPKGESVNMLLCWSTLSAEFLSF